MVTTIGAACAGADAELFSRSTSLASRSISGAPRASSAAAFPFLEIIAHAASEFRAAVIASIQASISVESHATLFSPSLTGGGNVLSLTFR
jgi:hypothetical protein